MPPSVYMAKKYEFKPDKPRTSFLSKLIPTRLQRRSILKWTLYALVLLVLSVLQDVLLSQWRFLGGTTELVPCGIFLICLLEGVERGSVFSLVASLVYLFSGSAAGYYSVVLITILAVFVTAFRQSYLQQGLGAALLCVTAAMLAYEGMVYVIALFLQIARPDAIWGCLVTAIVTLPAIPILYPIVHAIGGKTWNE